MSETIVENVWKFRTDPFFPKVDGRGVAINEEALERSLNPLLDPRVLPYYFDIYDWSYSSLVGQISPDTGLEQFPDTRTQPTDSAFMFLLSGCGESGLDSLANLILLKIRDVAEGLEPLVVEAHLDGREKERNVATVAKLLIATLGNQADDRAELRKPVEKIKAAWDAEQEQQRRSANPNYSDAFQLFRNQLRNVMKAPLVLKITGGGDSDSWVRIYNTISSTFSHMIVMTADPLYAKTAYDQMSAQNRNVAYIGALPLDCKKAHQFLLHRLARERISGAVLPQAGELMPFLKEAIDALFEPGSAEPRAGTITHPVGWLRRMLYRAWKDQLSALAGSPDVAAIKLEATFIGPAEIRRATSNVFRGSAR